MKEEVKGGCSSQMEPVGGACGLGNSHRPLVNSGSGSFLKKDLSKLLMTFRSLHFCNSTRGKCDHLEESLVWPTPSPPTHVVMDVDVVHALVVELLLHVGDGGVVPRDPVDARVLQPPLLHQFAADFHNQRNKLKADKERNRISRIQLSQDRNEDWWLQTLLFCAGGQSSSLTPNVTPGDGFFSKGFLISPGMPFLHVPLSLGGLVSS